MTPILNKIQEKLSIDFPHFTINHYLSQLCVYIKTLIGNLPWIS